MNISNILIFGSGVYPYNFNLHNTINKFDCVVRFVGQISAVNNKKYSYGSKTNYIVLNNSTNAYSFETFKEIEHYKKNNKNLILLRTSTNGKNPQEYKTNVNINNLFSSEEIVYIHSSQYYKKYCCEKYLINGATLTSGIMAILYFYEKYRNDNIYIHGFDFVQTNKHLVLPKHCARQNQTYRKHDLLGESKLIKTLNIKQIISGV